MTCSSSPAKTTTQEEVFHTFNALVEEGKQIAISGDRAPVDMEELDARIASRAAVRPRASTCIRRINEAAPRRAAAQSRAGHAAQSADRLADGVLEFMRSASRPNIRVVEGALTRLFAFADLVRPRGDDRDGAGLPVGHPCARPTARSHCWTRIIKTTCDYYNIRQADITGASRARAVARPRPDGDVICRRALTTRSTPRSPASWADGITPNGALRRSQDRESLWRSTARSPKMPSFLRRMLEA